MSSPFQLIFQMSLETCELLAKYFVELPINLLRLGSSVIRTFSFRLYLLSLLLLLDLILGLSLIQLIYEIVTCQIIFETD